MPVLPKGFVAPPAGVVIVAPSVDDGITPVWTEDVGTMTATWIDPTGVEWPLSNTAEDLGWFTVDGPAGWGATPVEIVTDPLPRGGEQVRFIRAKPRRLQWPIYIGADTHQEYTRRRRRLTRAITMTTQRRTPGWLKVQRPNGDGRIIACYYEQGLEGEGKEDWLWSKPVVQFFCPDGYWSSLTTLVVERSFTGGGVTPSTTFFSPFFTIGSSQVSTGSPDDPAVTVVNPGDVEAWPVWTITGPMSKLTAKNLTVGSQFALTHTLAAGQQIVITTNRPTVRGPGDTNLTGKVDWFSADGAELWPLLDGSNEIQFTVNGAGAGTHIKLAFTPRHETA